MTRSRVLLGPNGWRWGKEICPSCGLGEGTNHVDKNDKPILRASPTLLASLAKSLNQEDLYNVFCFPHNYQRVHICMINCKSPKSWISIGRWWCLAGVKLHYSVGGNHGHKSLKNVFISQGKYFYFYFFGFCLPKNYDFFGSKGKKVLNKYF